MTMIDTNASAFLIPSQISSGGGERRRRGRTKTTSPTTQRNEKSLNPSNANTASNTVTCNNKNVKVRKYLVPSQVLKAHTHTTDPANDSPSTIDDATDGDIGMSPSLPSPRGGNTSRRRRQRHRKKTRENNQHQKNGGRNGRRSRSRSRSPTIFGNLPDIEWRSIPEEHLRAHPCFEPLPPSNSLTTTDINSMEDVRLFRQSSWQWDVLHRGRCTTSQAVAALGFLEEDAGSYLNVPRSLRRGGVGAYHRLRSPALRSMKDLQDAGFFETKQEGYDDGDSDTSKEDTSKIWTQTDTRKNSNSPSFAAKYNIVVDDKERSRRRRKIKHISQSQGFERSIRMMWGNVQEPTAVLTALNYFWKQDPRIRLAEVGMCGAGLAMNQTSLVDDKNNGLLVGATPDAILIHPDGSVEAVEVKNHCPFFPATTTVTNNRNTTHSSSSSTTKKKKTMTKEIKRFRVRSLEFRDKVLPHYVPQLQMEMMCVGNNCRSVIMVRQTATNGSLIMRMYRDDAWITEMMYWLNRFQNDYVNTGTPPPPNFFFRGGTGTRSGNNNNHNKSKNDGNTSDHVRYKKFLEWTKNIESKVEILDHLQNDQIQRADDEASLNSAANSTTATSGSSSSLSSLFLDD